MNAKFASGSLKFRVPHTPENAVVVAFRSGQLNHLLPPDAVVVGARVAPSERPSSEATIIVDLRYKQPASR